MKLNLLILSLITLPIVAVAEVQYSAQYQSCLDNSGGVTYDMRICNANELKYQDKILNKNYKTIMKALDTKHRIELKKVQRQWIIYRDAKCNFLFGLTGGTIDLLMGGNCHIEMTVQRANDLKNMMSLLY